MIMKWLVCPAFGLPKLMSWWSAREKVRCVPSEKHADSYLNCVSVFQSSMLQVLSMFARSRSESIDEQCSSRVFEMLNLSAAARRQAKEEDSKALNYRKASFEQWCSEQLNQHYRGPFFDGF